MIYSKTRPVCPGYYWMRDPFGHEEIVRVSTSLQSTALHVYASEYYGGGCRLDETHREMEFAGPIPKPEDSHEN